MEGKIAPEPRNHRSGAPRCQTRMAAWLSRCQGQSGPRRCLRDRSVPIGQGIVGTSPVQPAASGLAAQDPRPAFGLLYISTPAGLHSQLKTGPCWNRSAAQMSTLPNSRNILASNAHIGHKLDVDRRTRIQLIRQCVLCDRERSFIPQAFAFCTSCRDSSVSPSSPRSA